MKVNRHHKPRQVLRFVYPNLWNNWEKQCHNKGEEKQPVGLWTINTIQWAAHHCEIVFLLLYPPLGERTWSCYGWHASMLEYTIGILHVCWVIHSIKLYCMFDMPSGMYIIKELLWQFVLIVNYISIYTYIHTNCNHL